LNWRLLVRWALNAVALMLVPEVVSSMAVTSFPAALVSALLIGLVNALIRPILLLITLPITVLTFGVFALIINGLMFWLVSALVSGFVVPDFATAFWGALLYSILTWLVSLAMSEPLPIRRM